MPFSQYISERAVGQYPISIATSLAIEAINGIHPDIIVKKAPILEYPFLWINVRTLFRNFMGSLQGDAATGISYQEIAAVLSEEMDTLVSIIRDATDDKTKVVFYYSDYADLESKYKTAVIRRDNTEKQKAYTSISNQALGELIKQYNTKESLQHILVFKLKLTLGIPVKALILTHYAYDLLSHKAFKSLTLLESHTGKLKEQAQWHTKYYTGSELSVIPFREDFIQIFGDAEIFRPGNIRWRKELLEIATKYKWSAVTTHDKIVYGIDQIKDHYFREVLKSILVR